MCCAILVSDYDEFKNKYSVIVQIETIFSGMSRSDIGICI